MRVKRSTTGEQSEMDERDDKRIRSIVRSELIGIFEDAKVQLGTTKDPTGLGRKALDGLASMIRRRDEAESETE
jgi:hypothetical protein